jgi:hypothetical protein
MSSRPLTRERPDLWGRLPRNRRQRGREEGSNLNFNSDPKFRIHNSELASPRFSTND